VTGLQAVLALGLALVAYPPLAAQTVAEQMAAIEGAQPTPDDANPLAGVSIAVIRDFEIHWAKGYGIADVETGAPVDTDTMFQAASMSKPVAAMATLRAVQDGLFTLDDDINDILTSWRLDGGEFTRDHPVTPRTLTSHTSGLGDAFGFPGYDPADPIPTAVQVLEGHELSNVGPVFMERAPMVAFEYSGGGVTVMQQALADARGRAFEDILHDDVLAPIGMTRSSYQQPISPEHDRNAARAHGAEGESMGSKWHIYPEMAAAGLWTTPSDLARFLIEVQKSAVGESNRVLSRAMTREMLTPVGVGGYAVGFGLRKIGEGWYFSHGGSNWGFQGTMIAHTVKGYGLAIMTNGSRGGAVANELSRRIQVAYEWDAFAEPVPRGYAPPVERTEIAVAEEILATYVGDYALSDELTLVITLENGGLFIEPTGQGKFPLFAESETEFFLRVANAQITFMQNDAGEVTSLLLRQDGRERPAAKVR
jgi:CubicO group peptidase (beta-lactamase class C family)